MRQELAPLALLPVARIEIALLLLVITLISSRFAPALAWALTGRMHHNLRNLVRLVSTGTIWVVGMSAVLSTLGVPVIAAFGVGVVGAALAMATAQVGQGLLAGAWLLLEGDFDEGSTIISNGYRGVVMPNGVRLRSIKIDVIDTASGERQIVTLPNQVVLGAPLGVVLPAPPELIHGD